MKVSQPGCKMRFLPPRIQLRSGCVSNTSLQQSPGKPLEGSGAREVEVFAERLFRRLPKELAARLTQDQRLEIAREALDFFAVRSEPVKVRVCNRLLGDQPVIVIETAMPDCAFIVDSSREYLHQRNAAVMALLHPIFSVARDRDGRLVSFEEASAKEQRESFVQILLETHLDDRAASELAAELQRRMQEVLAVTQDSEQMTAQALQICDALALVRELIEVRDFLRWLAHGGFLFLGYQHYNVNYVEGGPRVMLEVGSGLGVLRDQTQAERNVRAFDTIESLEPELLFNSSVLIVSKSHLESHVHRLEPMDDILIRRTDADGRTVGFDRFMGMFTARAAIEEAQHIPICATSCVNSWKRSICWRARTTTRSWWRPSTAFPRRNCCAPRWTSCARNSMRWSTPSARAK